MPHGDRRCSHLRAKLLRGAIRRRCTSTGGAAGFDQRYLGKRQLPFTRFGANSAGPSRARLRQPLRQPTFFDVSASLTGHPVVMLSPRQPTTNLNSARYSGWYCTHMHVPLDGAKSNKTDGLGREQGRAPTICPCGSNHNSSINKKQNTSMLALTRTIPQQRRRQSPWRMCLLRA